MQNILVILIFLIACFYLGKKLFQSFTGSEQHCEGCAAAPMQHKKLKKQKTN